MKVLIVKMSSMGDVIHTFPAITEALHFRPDIEFHWVVEKSFVDLVSLHPGVKKIIPIELRKWRKPWWKFFFKQEWLDFRRGLRGVKYDVILDTQGALKSVFVARNARGPVYGYDRCSIRESIASFFYHYTCVIDPGQHVIHRARQLFGDALGYDTPQVVPNYGLDRSRLATSSVGTKKIILLHGTTWVNKHYPESYWMEMAELFVGAGFHIQLLWGNDVEHERALRLAEVDPSIEVMPRLSLLEAAKVVAAADAAVAVDTGLGHLAAALGVPMVFLYGPTEPDFAGGLGASQINLRSRFSCAPCMKRYCAFKGSSRVWPACFEEITPERVVEALKKVGVIKKKGSKEPF